MRKAAIFLFVFLLAIGLASAASVTRTMDSRVSPGSDVEIKLVLDGANVGESVAIEDNIPNTISVSSWDISGADGGKSAVSYAKKASSKAGIDRHSWSFKAESASPAVTYKITAPAAEGAYEFDVRWVTKDGFNHQVASLTVRTISCGDGICEGAENSDSCASDCPAAPAPVETTPDAQPPPAEPKKGKSATLWVLLAVIVVGVAIVVVRYKKKNTV